MCEPTCVLSRIIHDRLRWHGPPMALSRLHPSGAWRPQRLRRNYAITSNISEVYITLLSPPLFFIAPHTLMSGLGMTDVRMATWHIG